MANDGPCIIDGCDNKSRQREMCPKHYERWRTSSESVGTIGIYTPSSIVQAWIEQNIWTCNLFDCLEWPFRRLKAGYGIFKVDGFKLAHQFVCSLAHGEPKEGQTQVRHLCGNGHKGCVNPFHLAWGTVKDNAQDRIDHNTALRGEDSPPSKLKENEVIEIRKLWESGIYSQREISEMFGISASNVWKIVNNLTWTHI
jgi:predicted XRE-type DNA-binding protein